MATRLSAGQISDLDPYKFMAVTGKRVIHPGDRASTWAPLRRARVTRPGGRVPATESYWRSAPTAEARQVFLGQVCPGMRFDSVEDWVSIYASAGPTGLDTETGPFEMMTPRGFLADEGLPRCLAIMGQLAGRPAYARKMDWLIPRMARAVPYLGYVIVAGTKPA